MINKKKVKKELKKWKKQNRAAQAKLKRYKEEEKAFMKRKESGSKYSKLKKL